MSARAKHALKIAFLLVGVGVVVYLVSEVGPARVLETLVAAGPFMAFIVLLDVAWFVGEIMAHRVLLEGEAKKLSSAAYLRAQLLTYVFLILVPAGRAGAEVARAASIKDHVGAGRAAAAATNAQAVSLLANTLISVPCVLAMGAVAGFDHALTWMMVLNGVVTFVGGGLILVVSRKLRVGRLLGKRLRKMVHVADDLDGALRVSRGRLMAATGFAFLGRVAQTLQYGIALVAVGGSMSFAGALLAQGVHLVGAFAGDFIPNQVGVLEGTYRIFAGTLGFADEPARAVSIALLVRISQLILATSSLLALLIWRGRGEIAADAKLAMGGGGVTEIGESEGAVGAEEKAA